MNNLETMKKELEELNCKIDNLVDFLEEEIENPKVTDEKQRILLYLQGSYMRNYANILEDRIDYEESKRKG